MGWRLDVFNKMYNDMDCNILAFDYRGYGDSSGSPNEQGLKKDAEAVYRLLMEKGTEYGVDPDKWLL